MSYYIDPKKIKPNVKQEDDQQQQQQQQQPSLIISQVCKILEIFLRKI